MGNPKRKNRHRRSPPNSTFAKRRGSVLLIIAVLAGTALLWAGIQIAKTRTPESIGKKELEDTTAPALSPGRGGSGGGSLLSSTGFDSRTSIAETPNNARSSSPPAPGVSSPQPAGEKGGLPTLEVANAVMVTVELDFGGTVPTIAAALLNIERRYQPDDGNGRTFAILDAYGEGTWTGKLHLSMHVSAEKPGTGSLIFKRTGETLWSSRIVPSKQPNKSQFTGKNLSIYIDDGAGKLLTVDGSNNPTWIMDAVVKERGALLGTVWPSGVEHEVTVVYSACGCPVKVMARREGDRVVRTKELRVMFPDDPAVVEVIAGLMRW